MAPDGTSWLRFEYDSANRLRIVKRDDGTLLQAFQYGTTNELLMDYSYVSNQFKLFVGQLVEYTEFTPQVPVWTKSYISAGERLVSTASLNGQSETIEHHHSDRLGTRIVTNPTTGGYFEQETLPFGTALDAESSGYTNRRFTS